MTHSVDQNTLLYAAVTDVIAEVGAVKKNPMAGSIPFVGLDAALERMRQVALDVPTVQAIQTDDAVTAEITSPAAQPKDSTATSTATQPDATIKP